MKKNFDIEKAEAWARSGFHGVEKNVKFTGLPDPAYAERGKAAKEKERGGFFSRPAIQLAGVFLAAAIVGAGTFTALKYLEKRGAQTGPGTNAVGSNSPEDTNKNRVDGIEKVEYDTVRNTSANGSVALITNGETHFPQVNRYGTTRRTSDDEYLTALYDNPPGGNIETYDYNGGISLYNNVKDREIKILTLSVISTGNDIGRVAYGIDELNEYLDTAPDGFYFVRAEVTWDDTRIKVGESYDIYTVQFQLSIGNHDTLKNVHVFRISECERSGGLYYILPLDKEYRNVRQYDCKEAEELGYGIFSYVDAGGTEQICIQDEKGRLVFDSDTREWAEHPDLIIYGEGPTGPYLFYIETTDMEKMKLADVFGKYIYTVYAYDIKYIYTVYAYDITNHKRETLAEIGPGAYDSGLWDISANIAYYEEPRDIEVHVSGVDYSSGSPVINFNKKVPITFENGKYQMEQPGSGGFEPPVTETSSVTDEPQYVEVKNGLTLLFDTGMDTGMDYSPEDSGWTDFKNGGIYKACILDKAADVVLCDGALSAILNNVRTTWTLTNVNLNGERLFDNLEDVVEYIRNNGAGRKHHLKICVSWDSKEKIAEGTYREYVYDFILRAAETHADTTTAPDPEFETSPELVDAMISGCDTWLKKEMWEGITSTELIAHTGRITGAQGNLKKRFLAGVGIETGGFTRAEDDYFTFMFECRQDNDTVTEARLIISPGYTDYDLPFGITLDMSVDEALKAMGFDDDRINEMKTANEKIARDGLNFNYSNGGFTLTYVIRTDTCVTSLGIELDGRHNNAYVEMEMT